LRTSPPCPLPFLLFASVGLWLRADKLAAGPVSWPFFFFSGVREVLLRGTITRFSQRDSLFPLFKVLCSERSGTGKELRRRQSSAHDPEGTSLAPRKDPTPPVCFGQPYTLTNRRGGPWRAARVGRNHVPMELLTTRCGAFPPRRPRNCTLGAATSSPF